MEGSIPCAEDVLNLHVTFNCGQCYRWNHQPNGNWIGVFRHCVWVIKQQSGHLLYKVYGNLPRLLSDVNKFEDNFLHYRNTFKISEQNITDENIVGYVVWDFFRLFENLEEHYKRWSLCDSNFREKANQLFGLRMLKQDPEEIVFTFICSSNTTINRIRNMVETLCSLYGEKICDVNGVPYYDFPDTCSLADPPVVQDLKKAKFGYRAEYIVQSACKIMKMGGKEWFKRLKSMNYQDSKIELMQLPGVGEKVADCICLMGLDHLNAIPVDTHVFQIGKQYIPALQDKKSVTKAVYKQIADFFRTLFGHHAGWAHVVLFCADLKMHQTVESSSKVKREQIPRVVVSKYFKSQKTEHKRGAAFTD